jgi:hypothetical protein
LSIDQIDHLIEEIQQIHLSLLQPMPDARKIIHPSSCHRMRSSHVHLELGQVLENRKEKIKSLAYQVSSKLKGTI